MLCSTHANRLRGGRRLEDPSQHNSRQMVVRALQMLVCQLMPREGDVQPSSMGDNGFVSHTRDTHAGRGAVWRHTDGFVAPRIRALQNDG